jgi:outer membrane lipoprotein
MGILTAKPGLLVLLPALLLGACAAGPTFDTRGVDPVLTPKSAAANPRAATGRDIQWGGTILATTNLKDQTLVEVLAYPLDSNAKPRTSQDPLGRFVLEQASFLEPATYAKGRLITVVGTVTGTRTGWIDETAYTHPVVAARQNYLWPIDRYSDDSRVFFGIGVGSGGSWGSGVGIGF